MKASHRWKPPYVNHKTLRIWYKAPCFLNPILQLLLWREDKIWELFMCFENMTYFRWILFKNDLHSDPKLTQNEFTLIRLKSEFLKTPLTLSDLYRCHEGLNEQWSSPWFMVFFMVLRKWLAICAFSPQCQNNFTRGSTSHGPSQGPWGSVFPFSFHCHTPNSPPWTFPRVVVFTTRREVAHKRRLFWADLRSSLPSPPRATPRIVVPTTSHSGGRGR